MHPTEDDTSSTALEPPVPTTQESLAQAAGTPVSSHIPPPAPHQTPTGEATPSHPQQSNEPLQDFETRFATRLFSLEATLAQRAPTADVAAVLAVRLSVIEEQSGLQQRVSTVVKRNVPLSAEPPFSEHNFHRLPSMASRRGQNFLVQFDSVADLNGLRVQNKAQALVMHLRGAALEYVEYIPHVVRENDEAQVSALETKFGDSHLLQFYLTQLKHIVDVLNREEFGEVEGALDYHEKIVKAISRLRSAMKARGLPSSMPTSQCIRVRATHPATPRELPTLGHYRAYSCRSQ
ncbi:hypothetical protein HPB51_022244 [Rhipicephalus microplus]|uniref:Uncharacterized protein n=1 Tax=Rhipicephalus microplus TaxID=6941 RepID=A0A9J6DPR6_RHIMP|nr:hypothetical protein HPB51_022244 [Rhipicephalus microplus]